MENIYYARSANEQGQKETVFHHLSRASELCQEFLSPLGYGAWGEVLGKFHDFGKYSEDFQQVLRREKTHVNHAGPGAALVFQAYGGWSHGGKGQNRAAKLLASVIASHHGELSLVDDGVLKRVLRGEGDRLDSEGRRFSLFGQEEFRDAVSQWKSAFTPPQAVATPAGVFRRGRCIFGDDAVDAVSVFCLGGCGLFQRCGTSEARTICSKTKGLSWTRRKPSNVCPRCRQRKSKDPLQQAPSML